MQFRSGKAWKVFTVCLAPYSVKRSKIKVTQVFLSPLCGSMPIWQIELICGTNTTHEVKNVHHFLVKSQRSRSHRSFEILVCPLHISGPIWLIGIICGTNMTHEVAMRHVSFSGQKDKGQGHMGPLKFLLCLLGGYVRIWPVDFISGTNATPWGGDVLRCAPYSSKKSKVKVARVVQSLCRDRFVTPCLFDRLVSLSFGTNTIHMRWRCVKHHFQVKRGKVKVIWVIWSICCVLSVAPCLFYWFMRYVAQILYSMRGQCVPCTPLPGQKFIRLRSYGSFVIFAVCAPWFCAYLISFMCGVRWRCIALDFQIKGSKVKVTQFANI